MNIKDTTKVYRNNRAVLSSVPVLIRKALKIEPGDSLEWDLDTKTEVLTINIIKASD